MSEAGVNYRFLSVIGEGGFGRVYRARMETADGFHRDVAIKVLTDPDPPKQLLQRFRDEARILALVRDRAFVGVQPPITIGGRWAVVMEFVDGVSAGAMIHTGPMPPGVAVEIVGEVARALHHAFHMEGPEGGPLQLLHRDIKPDNIQLTPAGEVRLLDFGIAKANFAAREFKTRHSLGGTPGYIAPERLQGEELPAGDVYSLGVVLHELVTGTRPRYAATVHLDESDIAEMAEEMDVDPAMLQDPQTGPVLRLAANMRAAEPASRPTARSIEESCRELRMKLPPPFFREWAEQNVPHRMELERDALVSQVLVATSGAAASIAPQPAAPSLAPAFPEPRPGEDRTITLSPSTPPTAAAPNLALGALVGGGAAVVVGGLGLVLIVVGLSGLFLWYQRTYPSGPPQLPDPAPVVLPEPPDPQPPDPEQPEPPEPDTVVPGPKPPGPVHVVPVSPDPAPVRPVEPVTVIVPDPTPSAPDPAPVVPVDPVPSMPTGRVVIKTVPSGAVVKEGGKELIPSGNGYELPTGNHRLEITSPQGETYTAVVNIKRNQTINICYSFDTNSACGQ